jgi:hypothetical protein
MSDGMLTPSQAYETDGELKRRWKRKFTGKGGNSEDKSVTWQLGKGKRKEREQQETLFRYAPQRFLLLCKDIQYK